MSSIPIKTLFIFTSFNLFPHKCRVDCLHKFHVSINIPHESQRLTSDGQLRKDHNCLFFKIEGLNVLIQKQEDRNRRFEIIGGSKLQFSQIINSQMSGKLCFIRLVTLFSIFWFCFWKNTCLMWLEQVLPQSSKYSLCLSCRS